jgi:type II secretory pathway component PulF
MLYGNDGIMTINWKVATMVGVIDFFCFLFLIIYNLPLFEEIWGILHFPSALLAKQLIDIGSFEGQIYLIYIGYFVMFLQTFLVSLFVKE